MSTPLCYVVSRAVSAALFQCAYTRRQLEQWEYDGSLTNDDLYLINEFTRCIIKTVVDKYIGRRSFSPPCFHNSLHIMQTSRSSNIRRLQTRVNLSSFLKLHNLLRRLELIATVINKTSKEKFSRIDNDPLGAKEHACELFLERAREH